MLVKAGEDVYRHALQIWGGLTISDNPLPEETHSAGIVQREFRFVDDGFLMAI